MATVNLRDLVALLQSSFANRDAARNAADASEALSCHVVAQRAPEAADLGWFFLVAGKERAAETAEAMAGALNADWAQVSRAQAHEAPNVACFIIPSPRPGASAIRWPAELALGMAEARCTRRKPAPVCQRRRLLLSPAPRRPPSSNFCCAKRPSVWNQASKPPTRRKCPPRPAR